MLNMDEINKIRKNFFNFGKTKNELSKKFNRSWDTINRIVLMDREDFKNRGKRPNRKGNKITDNILNEIEKLLIEEKINPVKKKQRLTCKKIYLILKKTGLYTGSERSLYNAIKKVKEKLNQSKNKTYLPLFFKLGSTLQIDHGEADLYIDNNRYTGYLFVSSVPGFSLRFCQIFPTKSKEAWGEFHERAFNFFGGIFFKLVYDNDSVLIKKIIGSDRYQTTFSLSLEEHYNFESVFCNPASGNEKGAVENAVGYCRRNFLNGCPKFSSWDNTNKYLLKHCLQDINEGKHYKTHEPLISIFNRLKSVLNPLPPKKTWGKFIDSRVDSCQLVTIDNHDYSVPQKYVGTYVRLSMEVFKIKIFKDEEIIARHTRQYCNKDSLFLDHYLDQLQHKPSAFWDCKAVHYHKFDERFLTIWKLLLKKFSSKKANREFIKILFLGRKYSKDKLLKGLDEALKYKALDHLSIETMIRQSNENKLEINDKKLNESLNFINIATWKFDLKPYADLCEGGVRC